MKHLKLTLIALSALFLVYFLTSMKKSTSQPMVAVGVNPPIGSIIAYAGSNIPDGWLLCDGKTLNRSQFSSLFNAIGTNWGGTANDNFFLPDLRGRFLREVDNSGTIDPDAAGRTDINGNSVTGIRVGTYQNDIFQTHWHAANIPTSGGHSHPVSIERPGISGSNGSHDVDQGGDKFNSNPGFGSITASIPDNSGQHSHLIAVTDPSNNGGQIIRTGSETRPKNAYVYFIIRAK
jgi:microcystin-dependent protein